MSTQEQAEHGARLHRFFRRYRVAEYADLCASDTDDFSKYRVIIHQIPRDFHSADSRQRTWMLEEVPALVEPKWDALLAAVAEHVANLHDHVCPPWVDQPERFMPIPWVVGAPFGFTARSIIHAPPPFHRHGVLPDPLDLDHRGGERPYACILRD